MDKIKIAIDVSSAIADLNLISLESYKKIPQVREIVDLSLSK